MDDPLKSVLDVMCAMTERCTPRFNDISHVNEEGDGGALLSKPLLYEQTKDRAYWIARQCRYMRRDIEAMIPDGATAVIWRMTPRVQDGSLMARVDFR